MISILKKSYAWPVVVVLPLVLANCGSPEARSQDYFDKGMALLKQGDDLNARIALTTSLKYNGGRLEAWRALLGIDERTKAATSMFQDLRRIVELDPTDTDARLKLVRIMVAGNANDPALKVLDAAPAKDQSRADIRGLRATIFLRTNDSAGAEREAQQAIIIDPNNLEATLVLASEQMSRGDVDGALQRVDASPAESRDDPRVSALKVALYGRKGDLPKAEATLQKLVAVKPEFRSQLVQLYISERRFDDAEQELRAIAAAKPTDATAGLDLVRFLASFRGANAAKDELAAKIKAGGDVFPYQMALVQLNVLQGSHADAVTLLNDVIKKPDTPEHVLAAKLKLAELAIGRREFSTAEALIADVLQKDNRDTGALKLRAIIHLDRGQFDPAISDLREALNNKPKATDLLLLMATAYQRSGKPELADRQLADAVKASEWAPSVVLQYASYLQSRDDLAHAEDVLLEAVGRHPQNMAVLGALAQLRLARKNWAGALAISDAVRASGANPSLADQIKAAANAGKNNLDPGIAALEAAHAASVDAVEPVVLLVSAYVRAGTADKAEALLRDMLKNNPTNPQWLVLLGQTQAAEGKAAEAQASLKSAIAQNPKNDASYIALSNLYAGQKNLVDAGNVIQAGLKEHPNSVELKLAWANLLIAKGDNDAAILAYEAILKEQPASLLAANNLASLLTDNRSDKASLDRAAALSDTLKASNVPQYQDTVGWVDYRLGKTADATEVLEAVTKQAPNFAAARYHLAMSYVAAGQTVQAAEQFKTALNLEPDGTALKEKIRAAMK